MLYSSNNDICKGPPSANAVKADARYAVILSSSAGAIEVAPGCLNRFSASISGASAGC